MWRQAPTSAIPGEEAVPVGTQFRGYRISALPGAHVPAGEGRDRLCRALLRYVICGSEGGVTLDACSSSHAGTSPGSVKTTASARRKTRDRTAAGRVLRGAEDATGDRWLERHDPVQGEDHQTMGRMAGPFHMLSLRPPCLKRRAQVGWDVLPTDQEHQMSTSPSACARSPRRPGGRPTSSPRARSSARPPNAGARARARCRGEGQCLEAAGGHPSPKVLTSDARRCGGAARRRARSPGARLGWWHSRSGLCPQPPGSAIR
jgi:hypothetical protein